MDDIATLERTTSDYETPPKLDAVVIGAGVAGLYQLHLLRSQGLAVKAFEAGSDVGGTWYWNRYPGARFNSESPSYQYLFSQELYEGWDWSERFSAQPEIERWLQYVADRLDLRKDIEFNTTIKSAHFDEATDRWTITTDNGQVIDARFLITCCGMLSAPLTSSFPGRRRSRGSCSTPRAGRRTRSISPASASAWSASARRVSRSFKPLRTRSVT